MLKLSRKIKSLALVMGGLSGIGIGYLWHLHEANVRHEQFYGKYKIALAKTIEQEKKETAYEQKVESIYGVELFVEHDMKTIRYLDQHLALIAKQGLLKHEKKIDIVIPQGKNKELVSEHIGGLYEHNSSIDKNPLIIAIDADFDILVHECAHVWHHQMPLDKKKEFESKLNVYLGDLTTLTFEDHDDVSQWKAGIESYGVYPSAYANSSLVEYIAEIVKHMYTGFYFNEGGLNESSTLMKLDWKRLGKINNILGKYGFISKEMEQFYDVYFDDPLLRKWSTHKHIQLELRLLGYSPNIDALLNKKVQYRLFEDVGNIDPTGYLAGNAKLLQPKEDYTLIGNQKKFAYDLIYSTYLLQDFSYLCPKEARKEKMISVRDPELQYTTSSYFDALKSNTTLGEEVKNILTNADIGQALLYYLDVEKKRGEGELYGLVSRIKMELEKKGTDIYDKMNYSRPCLHVGYHLLVKENKLLVEEHKKSCEKELNILQAKGIQDAQEKYVQVLSHYDIVLEALKIPLQEEYLLNAQQIYTQDVNVHDIINKDTKHIARQVITRYFREKYPVIFK